MSSSQPLHELSASASAAAIAREDTTSVALVESCLEHIESRDALVSAWAHVDADLAVSAARDADAARAAGNPLGPLHGVPVGVKDIFDTADMPTECGSELHRDRRPNQDAAAVALLRRAGGIVLGKTVTAELALSAPGPTANPLDLQRTPGGSSSGSAAAVADCMVPVAVGSQTTGSVIRPASYCGIFGFKPTFGAIPTAGMQVLAQSLDHVGVFARSLADIELMARVLMPEHADMPIGGNENTARRPRIAVVRTPVWDEASNDARAHFDAWTRILGFENRVDLGDPFHDAVDCQRTILDSNLAANLGAAYGSRPLEMMSMTRSRVRAGLAISASTFIRVTARVEEQKARLRALFRDQDALLTLAAPGEAPLGLSSTGNAVFSAIWTLMGVPSISLPLLEGENGLPIGVQVIGAWRADAKLRTIAEQIVDLSTKTQGG